MSHKTFIIDTLSNEFYGIHREKSDCVSDNDHPFWTKNIDDAYDFNWSPSFSAELLANNEMSFNDLTDNGTRQPQIITVKEDENGNLIWK